MRTRGSVEPQEEASPNTNEEKPTSPPLESRLPAFAPESGATTEILFLDVTEFPLLPSGEAVDFTSPREDHVLPVAREEVAPPLADHVGASALALVGLLAYHREVRRASKFSRRACTVFDHAPCLHGG